MSTKDKNVVDLMSSMLAPAFGKTDRAPVSIPDPISPTPIVVTVDQLEPYDLNPRTSRNPKYEQIKESIRFRGLEQAPPISRKPGAEKYFISNGGNTRLEILRELWKETGDEKFYKIRCEFRPFAGDIYHLCGHISENDDRGDILFIEKAIACDNLRRLVEKEQNRSFSQRELAEEFRKVGVSANASLINRQQFAIETLLPVIPNLLWSGFGRDSVTRLIKVRTALWQVWRDEGGEELFFETTFSHALSAFDRSSENVDWDELQNHLQQTIALTLDRSTSLIAASMEAYLYEGVGKKPTPITSNLTPSNLVLPTTRINQKSTLQHLDTGNPIISDEDSQIIGITKTTSFVTPPQQTDSLEFIAGQPIKNDDEFRRAAEQIGQQFKESKARQQSRAQLREQNFYSAESFSESCFGLGGLIVPTKFGLGFAIDVPPMIMDWDQTGDSNRFWWFMFHLSGQSALPRPTIYQCNCSNAQKMLDDGGAEINTVADPYFHFKHLWFNRVPLIETRGHDRFDLAISFPHMLISDPFMTPDDSWELLLRIFINAREIRRNLDFHEFWSS